MLDDSFTTRTQLFGNTCLLYFFRLYDFDVVAELNSGSFIAVTLKIGRFFL